MRVWHDAAGRILRLTPDADEGAPEHTTPPVGATGYIEFDEDTNGPLLRALVHDADRFLVVGAELARDGQPVPIAPPGDDYLSPAQIQQIRALLSPGGPNLSQAQLKAILRVLCRRVLGQ